jgi:hypothetical protein
MPNRHENVFEGFLFFHFSYTPYFSAPLFSAENRFKKCLFPERLPVLEKACALFRIFAPPRIGDAKRSAFGAVAE